MSRERMEPPAAPERRRWTRRQVVYGSLGLLSAVAGAGWAAFAWSDARERQATEEWMAWLTRDAAPYAFVGPLDRFYRHQDLMQNARFHPPAQLLWACGFTHAGEWDNALRLLDGKALKDSVEARFLRELIQRRPQTGQWCQTFLDVWQSLGRPDFRESPLLPPALTWSQFVVDTRSAWDFGEEAHRFALLVLDPRLASLHPEDVQALLRASDSLPLLMALDEHLQGFEPEEPLRRAWLPVVEERLSLLAGASPQTLQMASRSFLAGSQIHQPFTRAELETLEGLASLPVWKQPSSEQTFLELREQFAGLPGPGHHAALLTRFAEGTFLGNWLLFRARASESSLNDEDRRWLGRLLWTVGARLREQHSLNEVEVGLRAQMLGSEWMQHGPSREDCIDWWGALGRWQDDLARSGFARWPLASLHEESSASRARDEVVWVRAFADPATVLR